ncbi:MAG TPA: protein-glutamate O-methyltransferase CheR [Spirochaetia bacterium]|nr:protein-glutamate O-methyltransferase CheR [Spirochaetia bacterium]
MNPSAVLALPVLTDDLFARFCILIQRETGICMRESKKLLVSNRLSKRMRQIGIGSFQEYYDRVTGSDAAERVRFIDAVTTNETYFYRGENHFSILRRHILPERFAGKDRVTVWCVGCSTGEEAYTLAIEGMEAAGPGRFLEVTATDISTAVLAQAQAAVYGGRTLRYLPEVIRGRYFDAAGGEEYRVKEEVRRRVRFLQHNALHEEPPVRGVDVIFCRNVMIYFDLPTQVRLVDERFASALAAEGYLFIGHSESLIGKSRRFSYSRIEHAPVYRLRKDPS